MNQQKLISNSLKSPASPLLLKGSKSCPHFNSESKADDSGMRSTQSYPNLESEKSSSLYTDKNQDTSKYSIKTTVGSALIAIWVSSSLLSTYVFSSFEFMNKLNISHISGWGLVVYLCLFVSAMLIAVTMGKTVFNTCRDDWFFSFEHIKKRIISCFRLSKENVIFWFLALCAMSTYGTLAVTAILTFLGSDPLSIFNAGLFGIGICIGLIPFIITPALEFLRKLYNNEVTINKRVFIVSIMGEFFFALILEISLQKPLNLLIHNNTVSEVLSFFLVIVTVFLITFAIQEGYAKDNKKDEEENKNSEACYKKLLKKLYTVLYEICLIKEIKEAYVDPKKFTLIMMGVAGGSFATYIGMSELFPTAPWWVSMICALMPIKYWAQIYKDGPDTIAEFFSSSKYKKCFSKKSLLIGTGFIFGGLSVVGIGAVFVFRLKSEISYSEWWTIACVSVLVGCMAAGWVASKLVDSEKSETQSSSDTVTSDNSSKPLFASSRSL